MVYLLIGAMPRYKDWVKLLAIVWQLICFMGAKCTGQDHGSELEIALLKSSDKITEKSVFGKIASKITHVKGGENVLKCSLWSN